MTIGVLDAEYQQSTKPTWTSPMENAEWEQPWTEWEQDPIGSSLITSEARALAEAHPASAAM